MSESERSSDESNELKRLLLELPAAGTLVAREQLLNRLMIELEKKETAQRAEREQLQSENRRLRQELRKLRAGAADAMSSRLRDALRE